eukprot:366540-Chlamydomonas_euryale.AAC.2
MRSHTHSYTHAHHGSRVRRRNDRRRAVPTAASPNERVPPRRRVRMHRRGAALAAGHKAVCAAGQWAVRAAGRWVLPVAAWQVVHAAGRWAVRAASRTAVCAASQWAVRSAGRRALPVAAWQAVRAADAAFGCGRQCVQEAGPAAAGPGATCVCAATHQSLQQGGEGGLREEGWVGRTTGVVGGMRRRRGGRSGCGEGWTSGSWMNRP